MTPTEIRDIRKGLELSANEFGRLLGLLGKNRAITVYRYETGERSPSGPVKMLLERIAKHMAERASTP